MEKPIGVRKNIAGCIVPQIIPMSLKKTLTEQSNKLRPRANIANRIAHGKMSSNTGLYTMPNQYIMMKKTRIVRSMLNNSLIVSDNGKK